MEAIKATHTDESYTTSDVDVMQYVPARFEHDETLDFKQNVNYIFTDNDDNVFRVTVGKDNFLFTVGFYAKNEEAGVSNAFSARDKDDVMGVRNRVLDAVGL